MPHLARGARIICLVRDAKAAGDLAKWLTARGWGASATLDAHRAWRAARKCIDAASRRQLRRRSCRKAGRGGAWRRRQRRVFLAARDCRTISSPMTARSPSGRSVRWRSRRWRRVPVNGCGTLARARARSRSSGHCAAGWRSQSRRARIVPPISAAMRQRSGWRIGSPSLQGSAGSPCCAGRA